MNIKPITLKPITPAAPAAPGAAPAAPAAGAAPAGIKPISIKPLAAAPAPTPSTTATIRMTPVPAAPRPAAPAAAPAPASAAAGGAPKGIRPISIKPPVPVAAPDVTAQAIKGKTSRISLDSAMLGQPAAAAPAIGRLTTNLAAAADAAKGQTGRLAGQGAAPGGDKPAIKPLKAGDADAAEAPTVKLKPISLKAPAAAPAAAAPLSEDSKPTLRLKSPGGATKPTLKAPAAESAAPVNPMGKDIEAPPSAFGGNQLSFGPKEKVGVVFPLVAIASAVALGYLAFIMFVQL